MWTTAATNAEQRSYEPCHAGAKAGCVWKLFPTGGIFYTLAVLVSLTAPHSRVTFVAAMPSGPGERYDFFLSRRGSVAAVAREVTEVLTEKRYRVLIQDYDFPLGTSFVDAMHEGIKNSRDLIILYTQDYESSPYTRKEFTSFEAERLRTAEERQLPSASQWHWSRARLRTKRSAWKRSPRLPKSRS
jgi:TIR domain